MLQLQTSSVIDTSDVHDFCHQIAGHTSEKVRRYQKNYILKPQNKVDLFQREVQFYEDIFGSNIKEQIRFLAKYVGVVQLLTEKDDHVSKLPHLVLDDLTLGYNKPCVIDIKMGRQTFEPTANLDKKEREVRKYPYQHEIGFRITGLKVWDDELEAYHCREKAFGRSILPSQVMEALAFFFVSGSSIRADVIESLILRLEGLLEWMEVQNRYKFYCSSILVVYDACPNNRWDEEADVCRSAMIDFAHVVSSEEVDHDYVYGLTNLIKQLQCILEVDRHADAATRAHFLSSIKKVAFA